jgi:hypothetical protein
MTRRFEKVFINGMPLSLRGSLAAASAAPKSIEESILATLGLVFSIVFLSAINIIISGHLLGYALKLTSEDREATAAKKGKTAGQNQGNVFTLGIPINVGVKLSLTVRGPQALAGFAAFGISLGIIGFFLSRQADTVFVHNLGATENHFVACQALATLFSVVICVVSGGLRLVADQFYIHRLSQRGRPVAKTPEQRAKDLTKPPEEAHQEEPEEGDRVLDQEVFETPKIHDKEREKKDEQLTPQLDSGPGNGAEKGPANSAKNNVKEIASRKRKKTK